jgi:hypothetical protein
VKCESSLLALNCVEGKSGGSLELRLTALERGSAESPDNCGALYLLGCARGRVLRS